MIRAWQKFRVIDFTCLFPTLKIKNILFFLFTKYSMFTDRIIKIIFFDNSFIVKIYAQKTNFFKRLFFSIGDTAVANRLRAFSKSVLGSPFRGLPTSQFWGGVLGNFLALFSNEPKFFTSDMEIWFSLERIGGGGGFRTLKSNL